MYHRVQRIKQTFNTAECLIEINLVIVKVLGNLLPKSIKAVKKNPVNNWKKN